MARKFTAEEFREMATEAEVIEVYDQFYGHDMYTIAAMLRQAADMMDREGESDVIQCRKCQTERSGEGYGDVPPPIGEDDICDRCQIAERLRHNRDAENQIESEKKYEYSVRYKNGELSCLRDTKPFKDEDVAAADCICVRREVGEWEEVPSDK